MAYKVVQWATGGVGMEALRGILRNPELELVGTLVYSAEKESGAVAEGERRLDGGDRGGSFCAGNLHGGGDL